MSQPVSHLTRPLSVGIAGLGVVGARTAQLLLSPLTSHPDLQLELTAVSARSKDADRGFSMDGVDWVDDCRDMAQRDDIDIIVELIGGSEGIAKELVEQALASGKHVVTANKALIAHHGYHLAQLAEGAGVTLSFEAAVAGGIPAIKLLKDGLVANRVSHIAGILNGTSNYILSEMTATGRSFDDVLAEAQEKGYAEADPSFDIDGVDAAHKLAILAAMAFGEQVDFDAVQIQGIRDVSDTDIAFAGEFGCAVKLIGSAERDGIRAVRPCLISHTQPLASINGALNAVSYEAEPVNAIQCSGPGAGAGPTASAVLADIADIALGRQSYSFGWPVSSLSEPVNAPAGQARSRYYIRLMVTDRPGVLHETAGILKDLQISVESMLQKGQSDDRPVALVMTTHETQADAIEQARLKLCETSFVSGDVMVLPIISSTE